MLEQTVLALFKQLCFYHSSWLRWFTRVPCKRYSSNTTKCKRKILCIMIITMAK